MVGIYYVCLDEEVLYSTNVVQAKLATSHEIYGIFLIKEEGDGDEIGDDGDGDEIRDNNYVGQPYHIQSPPDGSPVKSCRLILNITAGNLQPGADGKFD